MSSQPDPITSGEISNRLRRFWNMRRRSILLFLLVASLIGFLFILPLEVRNSLLFSLLAQRSLVVLLMLFSLVLLSLLWTAGERIDAWIFLLINMRGFRPRWLDRGMWLLTQLGNGLFSLLMGLFFYLTGLRKLSVELTLGTLSLWLVVETLKALTDRARPFVLLEDVRVIGWREPGLSFPSGHTSQVFFLATFLTRYFEFSAWAIFVLYGLAVLVGLTRLYVGAHYPRDVIAGALLGGVWGLLLMLVDVYFTDRSV